MFFTRPDGTLIKNLPVTRALLPVLLKTRNESAVYFEEEYDVTATQRFVDAYNASHDGKITVFHVFMWAMAATLHERPRLNRFVSGYRLWQRKGVHLSFVAKKVKLDDNASTVTIKREFAAGASIAEVAQTLNADIRTGRTTDERPEDREVNLLMKLPLFMTRFAFACARWADRWNLLPLRAIAHDPCYTSMFVANLGSVGLDAGYHHLFEWGNCPFFAVLGRTREVTGRLLVTVKYSFDERIDDGLSCGLALRVFKQRFEAPAEGSATASPAAGTPLSP